MAGSRVGAGSPTPELGDVCGNAGGVPGGVAEVVDRVHIDIDFGGTGFGVDGEVQAGSSGVCRHQLWPLALVPKMLISS